MSSPCYSDFHSTTVIVCYKNRGNEDIKRLQNLIINSVTHISFMSDKITISSTLFCIVMDTIKHQGMRNNLINALRNKKLYEEQVLDAMNLVPRHLFIDSSAFFGICLSGCRFPYRSRTNHFYILQLSLGKPAY